MTTIRRAHRGRWGVVGIVLATLVVAACSASGDDRPTATPTGDVDGATAFPPAAGSTSTTLAAGTPSLATPTTSPSTAPATSSSSTTLAPIERTGRVALPGLLDESDRAFPDDPAVRTGTLDNGLRYYIRANDAPGSSAELRLALDAGSVDEAGPTGVAHFLEHMLFNGTASFPRNELVDVLRGFGASFGADINASTGFDATTYRLTVPNTDESLTTGLQVLSEWLSAATIDPAEVVAERGVVLDEWRVRTQSAGGRLLQVATDLFLDGTPYRNRLPIGLVADIERMEAEPLRAYYDTWYRPDNAAVVVVGDIDVDVMEAEVRRWFEGATPRAETSSARPDIVFDLDTVSEFGLHVDPDQPTVDVEVTLPLPAVDGTGTRATRAAFVDWMVYDALVRRLDDDLNAAVAPFDEITRGTNSLVDGLDAPALYATTDAARAADALDALLDEYHRAAEFGFEDAEAAVARRSLLAFYQRGFDGRGSTQDALYADRYVSAFLLDGNHPSIADEFDVVAEILDGIDAAAMDRRFRARWTNSAPDVIISVPAGQVAAVPDADGVAAAVAAAAARPSAPRASIDTVPEALMDAPDPVEPIETVASTEFPSAFFSPVTLRYENGVTVIVNSNDIVEGQVFLAAASPGGRSLVADDDVVDSFYAVDVALRSGIAEVDAAALGRFLAGRDVVVRPAISPRRESFEGTAGAADLEIAMQLAHLYMTAPRFDEAAFEQFRSQIAPLVADPAVDRGLAASDAASELRYRDELRFEVLPEPDEFATFDAAGVERVFGERFSNPDGWVFVFSGDVDVDEVTDLADRYLGSLPVGEPEPLADLVVDPPDSVVGRTIEAGAGDTAQLRLLFTTPIDDIDARTRALAEVAERVLDARLTRVVREALGATYSPRTSVVVDTDPDPVVEVSVVVTGAPDRIAELEDVVLGEVADLAADGIEAAEFALALAEVVESYGFVDNGQFLDELLASELHPSRDLDDFWGIDEALADLDAADVAAFVAGAAPRDRYIAVTVVPRR